MGEGIVSTLSDAGDHELLALFCKRSPTEEAYTNFFSYICHLVGHLARSQVLVEKGEHAA
jgi:neuroblastoma-amplified sequence